MAQISLRAYTHEIEEMIEHNQFDQAIAHCRNILKYYPKHINTYRLLGKAFLESQRYGDAGDIFQRILSSFPEDFISHVGMSIIREDEGNLDDSLWHMERAFEIQPSNNAIQGELRRLHGKLEGTEPPKVRLTRGALAHMYIRGDLLSQAIAELRIALTEDPSRFDLQTVLAKAYYQSGQLAEAAKISNTIIEKLPYNFEANRILTDVYKKSDRPQEAEPYQERLFELDPYFAHTNDKTPSPDQVNDSAVTVERLDWKPGISTPEIISQPDWAKSIGVSIESPISPKANVPDWLSNAEETPVISNQPIPPIIDIKEEESVTPPSWERPEPVTDQISATWEEPGELTQISDETFIESIESMQEESHIPPEEIGAPEKIAGSEAEELAPADIPDWLRALKPQTSSLEGKLPEADAVPSKPHEEKEYSWLEESSTETEDQWEPAKEETEIPFSIPGEENTQVPQWLQESEQPVTPDIKAPEPIQEFGQFEPQPAEEYIAETFKEEKEEFSWLSDESVERTPEETIKDEAPVWFEETEEGLIPKNNMNEELPIAEEVELPEWLAQMKKEADQHPELIKPSDEIPDWVNNLEEPPISEEDTKPTRLKQQLADQEAAFSPGEKFPEAEIFGMPEEREYEETPLSSIFGDKDFEFKEEAEEISASSFTKTTEEETQTDWLTETEAQQQFEEGIFQGEKPEKPPDWVSQSLVESELPETVQEETEALEEVQLPDWLTQIAPKTDDVKETVTEAKPDWLSEYESQPSQEEFEEPVAIDSAVFTPEITSEDKTPEEMETLEAFPLQGFAESDISDETIKPKEETALPDWLLEYEEEPPTQTVIESIPEQQPISEAPAWFEQPEEISKLDFSFDEELPKEESIISEAQLPIDEIHFESNESEIRMDLQPAAEIPVFEESMGEIPFTETVLSEPLTEALPVTEAQSGETPSEEIFVEETLLSEAPVAEIPAEELPVEEALVAEIPSEELPVEEVPVAEILAEAIPVEEAPVPEIPAEELPVEEAPVSEIPAEELPVEEVPVAEIPSEELPVEEAPVAEILAEAIPVEEAPVPEIPAEELPVEEAPVAEIPAETIPVEEAPVAEIPAETIPVEEAPVPEIPAEELPVEESPVAEIPAETIPVEEAPVPEIPAETIPVEEAPVPEIPAEAIPVEEAPVLEIPAEELPVEEAPVAEIPAEELPVEESPVLEIPAEELPVEEAPVAKMLEEEMPIEETPTVEGKRKPRKKAPVTRLLAHEMPIEETPTEVQAALIDLNEASLVELERIPGIGFIKAQNIINLRNERGAFATVDELIDVPGFDEALVDSVKSKLRVAIPVEEPDQVAIEKEIDIPLQKARNELQQGKISEAINQYLELIHANTDLEEIAIDLQEAIDQYPTDVDIWQTLGDTCVRLGKLQDAINAYTQAEKLVR